MTVFQDVAIFWDIENCHPSTSLSGLDVVNVLREISLSYGSIKLFKAFLELSKQYSSKSASFHCELQASGVSLTDCPHNGQKDVADKMIIVPVDMLAFCIDHPAPATLILLSGDRDFAYAISVLRHLHYQVILVAPQSMTHVSLRAQASLVLDWSRDVLVPAALRSDIQGSSIRERARGASQDSQVGAPTLNSSLGIPENIVDKITPLDISRPAPPSVSDFSDRVHGLSQSEDIHVVVPEARLQDPLHSEEVPISPSLRPWCLGSVIPAHERVEGPMFVEKDISDTAPVDEVALPITSLSLPQVDLDALACSSFPESFSASSRASTAQGVPVVVAPNCASSTFPVSVVDPISAVSSRVKFRPLVDKLLQQSEMGVAKPRRSEIGSQLDQLNKQISEETGAATFGEYVNMAQKVGIVELGGTGASAWIALASSSPAQLSGYSRCFDAVSPPHQEPHDGLAVTPAGIPGNALLAQNVVNTPRGPTASPVMPVPCVKDRKASPYVPASSPSVTPTRLVRSPTSSSSGGPAPTRSPALSTSTGSTASLPRPSARTKPNITIFAANSVAGPSTSKPTTGCPAKFQPLLTVLQEFRRVGVMEPLRSDLATRLLKHDKQAYKRANLTKFPAYITLAIKEGIVQVGGAGNHQWVAIAPRWLAQGSRSSA